MCMSALFCTYICVSLVPIKDRNCWMPWNCSDSCEPPCEFWESNLGSLEEHGSLLLSYTVTTQLPSLPPLYISSCPNLGCYFLRQSHYIDQAGL